MSRDRFVVKTLKSVLALVAAAAATLAGLDVSGFATILPPEVATFLVIVPSAAAVVVHAAEAFSTALEKYFPTLLMLFCLGVVFSTALVSCVATSTTAPDGSKVETANIDHVAVAPWLDFFRDLFLPPPVPVVVPSK